MKANIDIENFIQDIRKYLKRLKICLELVKNPVHPRTGNPYQSILYDNVKHELKH